MDEKQKFIEDWRAILNYFFPDLPEEEVEQRLQEGLKLKFGILDEELKQKIAAQMEEAEKKDEELRKSGELLALMKRTVLPQAPNPSPEALVEAIARGQQKSPNSVHLK